MQRATTCRACLHRRIPSRTKAKKLWCVPILGRHAPLFDYTNPYSPPAGVIQRQRVRISSVALSLLLVVVVRHFAGSRVSGPFQARSEREKNKVRILLILLAHRSANMSQYSGSLQENQQSALTKPVVALHPNRKENLQEPFGGTQEGVDLKTTSPPAFVLPLTERDSIKEMPFVMRFSSLSNNLRQSPIRAVTLPAFERRSKGHDVVSLAGGLPDESLLAIRSLGINGEAATTGLNQALNYHPGIGVGVLVTKLKEIQHMLHPGSYEVACTCGSADGIIKTIELLSEPGDKILVENITWPGFLTQLSVRQRVVVPVTMDEHGPVPRSLDACLAQLEKDDGDRTQRIFYTVPTGHNPMGITVPNERKQQIYEICRRRNVVLLEDDPYYFLKFNDEEASQSSSYLSMDVDGRVVRFDSTSKIVAPGMRLGWVSASADFIAKYRLLSECTTGFPSGLSQMALLKLLESQQGWLEHIDSIKTEYRRRRDVIQEALSRYLNTKAQWTLPSSGMFFWVKLLGVEDAAVFQGRFTDAGVACVPGYCFYAEREPSPYIRLSYAYGSYRDLEEGVKRIAQVLADASA